MVLSVVGSCGLQQRGRLVVGGFLDGQSGREETCGRRDGGRCDHRQPGARPGFRALERSHQVMRSITDRVNADHRLDEVSMQDDASQVLAEFEVVGRQVVGPNRWGYGGKVEKGGNRGKGNQRK